MSKIIFDKDNTLTAPYKSEPWSQDIKASLENCVETFGEDNVMVVSNSIGLASDGFDDEDEILAVERSLGIKVFRRSVGKKPSKELAETIGGGELLKGYCVVGDRLLTDIVWGNSYGAITFHVPPLTEDGDNKPARTIRRLENAWRYRWFPLE